MYIIRSITMVTHRDRADDLIARQCDALLSCDILVSFKLIEHKVVDHKPLFLPPFCLGGVGQQVATDLSILVPSLYLE